MKPRTPCAGCPCLSNPWDGDPECSLGYAVGEYVHVCGRVYIVASENCQLGEIVFIKGGNEERFVRPASVTCCEPSEVLEPPTPADALLRDAARRIADEVCERLLSEPAWVDLVKHEEPI